MPLKQPQKITPSAKAKRIALIMAASLVGIGVASIATTVCIYDSFFERYQRPDYGLYPGNFCYDRVADTLPRETFKIPSGDCLLQGYYYPAAIEKGLVVLAHGFHAGADDYLPLIAEIVKGGYGVLAYDVTGVYSSEGESVVGMCQSLVDLDRVLTFAAEDSRFAQMPKMVVGHSWGGYAAASVLALHSEIKAAVLLAPMNNGATIMLEKSEQYAGKAAAVAAKPIFDLYQSMLFGRYVSYNGVVGINATTAPVLIAQGVDDTVITPDGQSITAHLEEITNPNLTLYWGRGYQGSHTGIWHSDAAEAYRAELSAKRQAIEEQLGRAMTDSDLRAFYSDVDHALYSQVNQELLNLMFATFDQGLAN